jgi:hypothetical protein
VTKLLAALSVVLVMSSRGGRSAHEGATTNALARARFVFLRSHAYIVDADADGLLHRWTHAGLRAGAVVPGNGAPD